MEISSPYNEYDTLPSIKLVPSVMERFSDMEETPREARRPRRLSQSSVCNDEHLEVDYVIFLDETTPALLDEAPNATAETPTQTSAAPNDMIHFIPTEENLSDCPTFLDNANQTGQSSNCSSSQNNKRSICGELAGQDSRAIKKVISSENYFPDEGTADAGGGVETTAERRSARRWLELPRRRMLSRPELNTAEEVRLIEENVRVNDLLCRYAWSSESLLDDGCRYDTIDLGESDEDMFYKPITSDYPLLLGPLQSPSDGSLIAVVDFDISDEAPETSGSRYLQPHASSYLDD